MKKTLLVTAIALACATSSVFAQGQIIYGNNSATLIRLDDTASAALGLAPNSPVPKGTSATSGSFRSTLYFSPGDASTTPTTWTELASTYFSPFAAGILQSSTVTVPGVPGGARTWFQMKVWETAYGNSYDAAVAAPAQGGRLAIAGVSANWNQPTGSPVPENITTGGFATFSVSVVPEPSTFALGLLGLAGLFILRRRQ